MSDEVVIVSAVRTAIGKFNGALASIDAVKLGSIVIQEALKRAEVNGSDVDEVIMGNVLSAGLGQNTSKQASMLAGIPETVPSFTVNKVCGSGLKAVHLGTQSILLGEADVVVAGGMENMSRAPYLLEKARSGYRLGDAKLVDSLIQDGLWCAFNDYHMGVTAENLSQKYGITREEQDAYAVFSQQKAVEAIQNGQFEEEIVPIVIPSKHGDITFATDEFPRKGTTMEGLSQLKPSFKQAGTVTPGNASGINDGAAAIVLMSKRKAELLGIKPLAKIKANATGAVDPSIMGIGPVVAVRKALDKSGIEMKSIQLIEANEAFAAQSLAVAKELSFDMSIVNVNGGAIALGHPIGASGARILVTLLHEMRRREVNMGLATLCIGGGQGIATVVERV